MILAGQVILRLVVSSINNNDFVLYRFPEACYFLFRVAMLCQVFFGSEEMFCVVSKYKPVRVSFLEKNARSLLEDNCISTQGNGLIRDLI